MPYACQAACAAGARCQRVLGVGMNTELLCYKDVEARMTETAGGHGDHVRDVLRLKLCATEGLSTCLHGQVDTRLPEKLL